MIQQFVDRFMGSRDMLRSKWALKHVDSYKELVTDVVQILHDPEEYESIDPNRVHLIDDGDYQGTLLFVIAAGGYQPSTYWYVKVSYGSCSGCDTLEGIRGYYELPPTEEQLDQYLTLALHVVQGLKGMNNEEE